MSDHHNPDAILEAALSHAMAGQGAALATVVETWGSAPRRVGSQLAISDQAALTGSVSGGCVEGAVVAEALDAMGDGRPRVLEFGVTDDEAFAVGLACGGRIRVLVDPVQEGGLSIAMLERLAQARAARQPIALVTNTVTWTRSVVGPEEFTDRFRQDRSGFEADGTTFVTIHNPPLRLAIIGGVHIAQPLVQMARLAGFDPFLIDPREAFASTERFPHTPLSHDWPDAALAAYGLDARTAIVTLTHDPKLDDPALLTALASPAFYIGCLGSTRTHGKRLDRLRVAGFSTDDLARLHGPVGLDIGAAQPGEIAAAILAEIIAVLRGKAPARG